MPFNMQRLWKQVRLGEDSDLELKEVQFRGGRASPLVARDEIPAMQTEIHVS